MEIFVYHQVDLFYIYSDKLVKILSQEMRDQSLERKKKTTTFTIVECLLYVHCY